MADGTRKLGIYKCDQCGNIVEVLHTGPGGLVCCGEEMNLLEEKTEDEGGEKHVPVIEKQENGYLVKVGSVEHPMEESHYIEWIELLADGQLLQRKHLEPNAKPEALFCLETDHESVEAREFCNLHGLWKS